MWNYEKKLLYPVKITHPELFVARLLLEPYAGSSSAVTAAMMYFNQRYAMPSGALKALLTDIGTEKLAHMEILAGMIMQSVQGASLQELKSGGLLSLYAAHGRSLPLADCQGVPWNAAHAVSSGNASADIAFDISLEDRLMAQYDRLIALCENTDYTEPLEFLCQRCTVHRQRFAEAADLLKEQSE